MKPLIMSYPGTAGWGLFALVGGWQTRPDGSVQLWPTEQAATSALEKELFDGEAKEGKGAEAEARSSVVRRPSGPAGLEDSVQLLQTDADTSLDGVVRSVHVRGGRDDRRELVSLHDQIHSWLQENPAARIGQACAHFGLKPLQFLAARDEKSSRRSA